MKNAAEVKRRCISRNVQLFVIVQSDSLIKSNNRQHAAIYACVRPSAHALVERGNHLVRYLTMQLVVGLADTKEIK
jgi:hypothetical protein